MVNRTKAFRILTAVLLVGAVIVASRRVLRPPQAGPIYQGRTLRAWSNTPKLTRDEWRTAVRAIGTNAIPLLLEMLEEEDSAVRRSAIRLAQAQHIVPVRLIPADARHRQAEDGFKALGEDADSAVPALVQLYEHSHSEWSRNLAASVLGAMGPAAKAAVPQLVRGATGTNPVLRLTSLGALCEIHSEPDLVVPIFTNCLADPDAVARQYAIKGLGLFQKDARQAVPALLALLNDPDPDVRRCATNALWQIVPEAFRGAGAPVQP
jgi:HEAT repeat protein